MNPVLVAPLPWGVGAELHRGFLASFPSGPGCAPTAGAEGTLPGAVASMEAARREAGWERVVIAGHSMGTVTALAYALDHPDRVARLVLVGGVAGKEGLRDGLWVPGHPLHAAWLDSFQRFRATGDMRAYVAELLRASLAVPEAWPALAADLAAARVSPARMAHFFRAELPKLAFTTRLREILAPTLVVGGREDPLCTPEQVRRMADDIPGCKLVLLGHCGHFPWYEQPEAFRAALQTFLRSPG